MLSYNSVIFDLDGTLLNTKAGIVKSLIYVTESLDLPSIPESKYSFFIGPQIEHSLRDYFQLNEERTIEAASAFRKVYAEQYLFDAEPYDGILDMLASLKSSSLKLAIATYKRHDYAGKVIEHFGLNKYCNPCLGSDPEIRTTKALIISACMSEMNADPSRTVYVGDTEHDRLGAEKAGISFIGVTYGFGYTRNGNGYCDTANAISEIILGGDVCSS